MSLPTSIVLPRTPEGETVRRFALAQTNVSYWDKDATPIFSENMVFNGLLFKMAGRDNIQPMFADFVANKILGIRFEAIVEAGSKNKYMLMYFLRLDGMDGELPVCDLLTLDQRGLICRLENCFDTTKCPQDIIDAGAPTIAAFKEPV